MNATSAPMLQPAPSISSGQRVRSRRAWRSERTACFTWMRKGVVFMPRIVRCEGVAPIERKRQSALQRLRGHAHEALQRANQMRLVRVAELERDVGGLPALLEQLHRLLRAQNLLERFVGHAERAQEVTLH